MHPFSSATLVALKGYGLATFARQQSAASPNAVQTTDPVVIRESKKDSSVVPSRIGSSSLNVPKSKDRRGK